MKVALGRWIGRSLTRAEDRRFTTGESRFVDDLRLPGMLHAAFVRSVYAHARLLDVDTTATLARPGVRKILTGRDLDGRAGPFPVSPSPEAEIVRITHPVLATDRVRYVGQAVAVVVAETPEQAADAAELVSVEYDVLPPVLRPGDASTPLHDEAPDNVLIRWRCVEGDVDRAFAEADIVVSARLRMPRLIASPLEPRGTIASYDAAEDLLTLWISAQDTHRQLVGLSSVLRRDPERLRIIVPDVGGAFGSKGVATAETAAVAFCALELDRPVKWIETRTENALASYQGRGADAEAELALADDGRMVAVRARYVGDLGAYLYTTTAVAPLTAGKLLTGCYAIPAADVEVVGAATTKVPTGPYRGAGRPEAAYILERLVDLAARELGMDAVELRRRNLVPRAAFPYRTPLGFTYDSGDYEGALDRALELAELGPKAEHVGVGVAMYVERVGPGWETAAVELREDGRIVVRTGSSPHGQGHETTFAQITAEALGVEPADVEVRWGDTAEIPEGMGTFASRSVTVGGSALLLAARELRQLLDAGERPPLAAEARFELPGPAFSFGAYVAIVELEPETAQVRVRRIVAVDDCGRIINPLLAHGQVVGATVQAIGECFSEQVGYDENGQPLAVNLYEYHLPSAQSAPQIVADLRQTPSPLNPLGAKGVGEGGSIGTPAALANAVADVLAPFGVRHLDPPFTPARVWAAIRDSGRGQLAHQSVGR
ncbi:MAG: xanthine dehydrogenase family protein molybdopterin-binding subunit [Gaiellaceae bacterium]